MLFVGCSLPFPLLITAVCLTYAYFRLNIVAKYLFFRSGAHIILFCFMNFFPLVSSKEFGDSRPFFSGPRGFCLSYINIGTKVILNHLLSNQHSVL